MQNIRLGYVHCLGTQSKCWTQWNMGLTVSLFLLVYSWLFFPIPMTCKQYLVIAPWPEHCLGNRFTSYAIKVDIGVYNNETLTWQTFE